MHDSLRSFDLSFLFVEHAIIKHLEFEYKYWLSEWLADIRRQASFRCESPAQNNLL